mmetsp:Transcript_10727/g.14784  ORF Transcript_10727/g.14784 Transcript_10727/m.14784 type:complete len:223 (+) Transcript_10727:606-1274(+)
MSEPLEEGLRLLADVVLLQDVDDADEVDLVAVLAVLKATVDAAVHATGPRLAGRDAGAVGQRLHVLVFAGQLRPRGRKVGRVGDARTINARRSFASETALQLRVAEDLGQTIALLAESAFADLLQWRRRERRRDDGLVDASSRVLTVVVVAVMMVMMRMVAGILFFFVAVALVDVLELLVPVAVLFALIVLLFQLLQLFTTQLRLLAAVAQGDGGVRQGGGG